MGPNQVAQGWAEWRWGKRARRKEGAQAQGSQAAQSAWEAHHQKTQGEARKREAQGCQQSSRAEEEGKNTH